MHPLAASASFRCPPCAQGADAGAAPTAAIGDAKPAPGAQLHAGGGGGSEWWRWLLVIVAAPVLLVLTLVGAVVWIVLLPVKICCCPIGFAAQLAWDALEWLVKAPFRAMLWASGKPWRPDRAERGQLADAAQRV